MAQQSTKRCIVPTSSGRCGSFGHTLVGLLQSTVNHRFNVMTNSLQGPDVIVVTSGHSGRSGVSIKLYTAIFAHGLGPF